MRGRWSTLLLLLLRAFLFLSLSIFRGGTLHSLESSIGPEVQVQARAPPFLCGSPPSWPVLSVSHHSGPPLFWSRAANVEVEQQVAALCPAWREQLTPSALHSRHCVGRGADECALRSFLSVRVCALLYTGAFSSKSISLHLRACTCFYACVKGTLVE